MKMDVFRKFLSFYEETTDARQFSFYMYFFGDVAKWIARNSIK